MTIHKYLRLLLIWTKRNIFMTTGTVNMTEGEREVNEYIPSVPEILVALGVWAMGFLVLTALFKIAIGVIEEVRG